MQEVPAHQSIYLVPLQFGDLQDSKLLHLDYTAVMDKVQSLIQGSVNLDAALSISLFLLPSPPMIVYGVKQRAHTELTELY